MIPSPISKEAYQLLHDGTLALADAEQRGMLVDVDYCRNQSQHLERKIIRLTEKLMLDPEVKEWKSVYRSKFNLGSDTQLADMLFKRLGYISASQTGSGEDSTDKLALGGIDSPMAQMLLELRGLQKTKTTYIDNLLREQVGGVLRPSFNLNTVQTYRSSSQNPNFQNQPTRDPAFKKTVRRAYIPRPDHLIVEVDGKGMEVCGAACYHKDPTMIAYITDKTKDMHRDMAMQCYMLSMDEWNGLTRYCAKNKYVFPEFYGSYYGQVAKDLWDAIDQMNLTTRSGKPLKKHLAAMGIKNYARFEQHIKEVEDDFWSNRFGVYGEWKEKHYKAYVKNGYADCLTGFRFQGLMRRNQVINYPIQGASFHCLLKAFIEVNRISKAESWRSGLIGQIHDSMVLEVHKDEYNHVMATVRRVMCSWVPSQWEWIIVPLEVEIEASPLNGSWFLKKEVKRGSACPGCGAVWRQQLKDKETGAALGWACPVCGDKDYVEKAV